MKRSWTGYVPIHTVSTCQFPLIVGVTERWKMQQKFDSIVAPEHDFGHRHSVFLMGHGDTRHSSHFWWTTFKTNVTYFNINEANLMILHHKTCTVQGDNVFKYRCAITRGFRLMNIQTIWGKVLTATARGVWRGWFKACTESEFTRFINLPERCQSVNWQQSLIFFFPPWGGRAAKRSKDGDDGEACEWWRNLWNSASVLTSRIC